MGVPSVYWAQVVARNLTCGEGRQRGRGHCCPLWPSRLRRAGLLALSGSNVIGKASPADLGCDKRPPVGNAPSGRQRHVGGEQFQGFEQGGVETWRRPDAGKLLLDGSFVTAKSLPGDYDGAWETVGVDPDRVDPVLLDFSNRRAAMKAKYLGDLFPASAMAAPGVLYRDFFKTDRNGVEKGIVLIDLGSLP